MQLVRPGAGAGVELEGVTDVIEVFIQAAVGITVKGVIKGGITFFSFDLRFDSWLDTIGPDTLFIVRGLIKVAVILGV